MKLVCLNQSLVRPLARQFWFVSLSPSSPRLEPMTRDGEEATAKDERLRVKGVVIC